MADISQILNTLNTSPSVELLRLRNREMIIEFLVNTFLNKQGAISSENIHIQLADSLEGHEVENDEESEISPFDTYEIKAKKYIQISFILKLKILLMLLKNVKSFVSMKLR